LALGKLVFEGKGKVTSQRVLEIVKGGAKIEASFIRTGKMNGIDVTNTGTFWNIPIEGGVFYGEAKGMFTTTDGDIVTYTAQGLGRFTENGILRFTGSDFLYTLPDGKFGALNNTVGVFEVEVNNQTGDITGKTFEWK
jgi:hypothetical protein